jgi:mediator of replication checkpoint protein 1
MASSTRSSSPASNASPPGSPELTPRSKLKALLAAVDEDSDAEDATPIVRKTLFQPTDKMIARSDEPSQADNQDEEDDDEEDDIIRPRGRIAARMLGIEVQPKSKRESSPQILVPETVKKTSQRAESHGEATDTGGSNDEDDEVSAAPRRRRIRPARSVTPEVTTNRDNSPASPGLFVSPSPQKSNASHHSAVESDSDSELPADVSKSSRFQALVARKREERLAKEAEESRKRDERAKRMVEEVSDADDDDDVSDISDDEGGRTLTQQVSRPAARKASKKALEEMNRETQRLSRSLQLAHEAKTKKKISKSTLFERFNFKPIGVEMQTEIPATSDAKLSSSSRPTTPVSAAHTDVEAAESGTPPSSPPSVLKKLASLPASVLTTAGGQQADLVEGDESGNLPDLQAALAQAQSKRPDKGKGKATLADLQSPKKSAAVKPKRQVRVKLPPVQANMVIIDSDDDELQITKPRKESKMDSIFNRVPSQQSKEAHSMHALRQLAHVSSSPPGHRNKNQKPSMTVGELQLNLQQRARAQAKLERERRLDLLKAKGIHVQTEEERQQEREQVEDIVLRARQEAEEIMAREREDAKKAKKERRENGEADHLDWDDSDDDSFADSEAGAIVEEGEIEFSGSEEEDEEMGDELDDGQDDEEEATVNPMFDEDAEEDEESETEVAAPTTANIADDADEEDEMDDIQPTKSRSRRPKKHVQILSDDEEEVTVESTPKPKASFFKSPVAPNSNSPKVPTSVLRSATKTFIPGLPVPAAGPAGLGLTQIFAGTMDDSQAGSGALASGEPLEFMPSFDNFPDSQFSATAGISQAADDMVLDSQTETQKQETQTQGVRLHFSQSQVHGFDSLMQVEGTQMSDMLNPTQDVGFAEYTPLRERFIEPPQSTVGTVVLNGSPVVTGEDADQMDSPLIRKRGKLRRRGEVSFAEDSTIPPTEIPGSPLVNTIPAPSPVMASINNQEDPEDDGVSAFKLMAKAARQKKRAQERFDRKKSKANGMVEVQAEESEDEYAGLGGADGEDSSDEEGMEELRKEMIDDKDGNDADEGKLAAFFA